MLSRILCGLLLLIAVPSPIGLGGVSGHIKTADALFDRWGNDFSLADYQEQLEGAIAVYKEALALVPAEDIQTHSYLLNRLAQCHFELGHAYLTARDKQEATFALGKDYALASLRLDPGFRKAEKEGLRTALRSANDVSALFWYGNNLGRYLESHMFTAITGGMNDVLASFTRATELDETYLGGGPWRALGSFLAQVPVFLGGDLQRAEAAFERAIELGPDFLENYVDYAEYCAKAKREWESFCRELATVLELTQDSTVMDRWPLYNKLALVRAKELVRLEIHGTPVCNQ
ncbi:MAG: TRAP transporter TatT component family protein [Candidatus Bipolaricaulota bacterium]|nr:TRAP transporter TatT component family protein [Candidatus Bipolaricaulota bacterium]